LDQESVMRVSMDGVVRIMGLAGQKNKLDEGKWEAKVNSFFKEPLFHPVRVAKLEVFTDRGAGRDPQVARFKLLHELQDFKR